MIFDYHQFVLELRRNLDKENCVQDYEKHVSPLGQQSYLEETWYKELVERFPPIVDFKKPPDLIDHFDWGLLVQLGASSLSAELILENIKGDIHISIRVESKDETVENKLIDLWGFQIKRIIEIWIKENINYCSIGHNDEKERLGIYGAKKKKYKLWKKKLEALNSMI